MTSILRHVTIEVSCPTCPDTYAVSLETIEESQRLLDEYGPCSGMECPAAYFASLAPPSAIARLEDAATAFEAEMRRRGARAKLAATELARWDDDGGAARTTT